MPQAGDTLTPTDQPQGLIAQYERVTSSASAAGTTELGYVNMNGIPVRNGYSYKVTWLRAIPVSSASFSGSALRIRGSQSGTAVVGSTMLRGGEARTLEPASTSNGEEITFSGVWECTSSGTLSLWFGFVRTDGAGTITMFGSASAFSKFLVEEIGPTQTNSGTDL